MDTSIIVVIAIAVVFVVVMPALIRRSSTELSRVDLDRLPDQAEIVRSETQNPCRDRTERVSVFRAETIPPTVPQADSTTTAATPTLRLSAGAPELSVIDGHGTEVAARSQERTEPVALPLPAAVGETGSAFVAVGHGVAEAAADNVRPLHPAVHAVFSQAGAGTGNSGSGPGGAAHRSAAAGTGRRLGDGQRSAAAASARAGSRGAQGARGTGSTTSPQTTDPVTRTDEDHSMTESTAALRESLRSIGGAVRGFALVFLASVLGVLVTAVLALLSVVHPALIGVFAGLAVVSLLIVRTLNKRRWEMKKRLRRSRPAPTPGRTAEHNDGGSARTAAAPPAPGSKRAQAPATAAGSGAARAGAGASATAARARAVMQRNTAARHAREEAVTGEIPTVRIRKEAAEGHTTRQILLTGPIPVVDSDDVAGREAESSGETTARSADPGAAAASGAQRETSASAVAADLVDTPANDGADTGDSAASARIPASAGAEAPARVDDPFTQRLSARHSWSPSPLPVPSYVDAPEADHPLPAAKAADASSYETEARSREDIAAQFAEELGYRAELSDSARDDSPLEHGRKAIRADRAPAFDAVNDVLARRRA